MSPIPFSDALSSGPLLRTVDISKNFGCLRAVHRVNIEVQPTTIAGLIGPNGAGKTTLFNLITRMLDLSDGKIFMESQDVSNFDMVELATRGVGRTFQTPRGFAGLSVRENVEVMLSDPRDTLSGALFRRTDHVGGPRENRVEDALKRVGLLDSESRDYESLSGGERRMLEIARQIVRSPRILLLDEPTAGLDRQYQELLRTLLVELKEMHIGILLVEHNLRFLRGVVDTLHVMVRGELLKSGPPDEVMTDESVVAAYQGKGSPDAIGS